MAAGHGTAGQALPRKWLLNTLLVLAVAATALQYRTIVGPEAGVVLILLLLVLKTLEVRARRDAMVIFFLGFFTLLTLFLQSQSLLMACAMLLAAWGCWPRWSTPICLRATRARGSCCAPPGC